MYLKNRNLLLILVGILVIIIALLPYFVSQLSENQSSKIIGNNDQNIIQSINFQNNFLINYFNSRYNAQISDINNKYLTGRISSEEKNKQLSAVSANHEFTINVLNKFSTTNKKLLVGNITKEDILIKFNSTDDLKTDIKTELNASLYG